MLYYALSVKRLIPKTNIKRREKIGLTNKRTDCDEICRSILFRGDISVLDLVSISKKRLWKCCLHIIIDVIQDTLLYQEYVDSISNVSKLTSFLSFPLLSELKFWDYTYFISLSAYNKVL